MTTIINSLISGSYGGMATFNWACPSPSKSIPSRFSIEVTHRSQKLGGFSLLSRNSFLVFPGRPSTDSSQCSLKAFIGLDPSPKTFPRASATHSTRSISWSGIKSMTALFADACLPSILNSSQSRLPLSSASRWSKRMTKSSSSRYRCNALSARRASSVVSVGRCDIM